jgi:hypothetical protein
MESLLTHDTSDLPFPSTTDKLEEKLEDPQTKKKRMLSEKQMAALKLGREKRWKRLMEQGQITNDIKPVPVATSYASDTSVSTEGYDTYTDSSTDEETRKRKKDKALKKSIPKPIRRRLDRYIKKKLRESQQKQQPVVDEPDYYSIASAPLSYSQPSYSTPYMHAPPEKPVSQPAGPVFL